MVLFSFFPAELILERADPEEAKNPAGENVLRLIRIRLATVSLAKISPTCQDNSTASADYRFEFQKRRQLLICANDETFSVAAMRVCNPDRPPVGIHR